MAPQVAAVAVRGTWLKHAYAGSPPLPEREPPPDNRWQRGSVVDALYLADNEETVWAEWYRHLAERMVPPLAQMPRELWRWQVDVEVADLSTPERLSAAWLPPQPPAVDRGLTFRLSASGFGERAGRAAGTECRATGRPDPLPRRLTGEQSPISCLAAARTSANCAWSAADRKTSTGASSSRRVLVPKSQAFAVFASKASTIMRTTL